jgi:hypothetical protein
MAVTYSIAYQDRTGRGKHMVNATLAYTTEAYSSGLTVSGAALGMPNVIESLMVYDTGNSGLVADFNGGKIRLYQSPAITAAPAAAAPLSEVSGSQTVTLKVVAIGW